MKSCLPRIAVPAPTNGNVASSVAIPVAGLAPLRLGGDRQQLFDAVIALSPDSDFPHQPHAGWSRSPRP